MFKIIKKLLRIVKREIVLYLIFRRLSHSQIEQLRRQAELIEAARRREQAGKFEYRLVRCPDGLPMLEWLKAVA